MSKQCPACRAPLEDSAVICDYCLSSVVPKALSGTKRQELAAKALGMDRKLRHEMNWLSWGYAGLCLLFMTAAFFIARFLLLYAGFSMWTSAALFSTALIACILTDFILLPHLQSRRLDRHFERKVKPQLASIAADYDLPCWQLEDVLRNSLPAGSPLLMFLSAMPERGSGGR